MAVFKASWLQRFRGSLVGLLLLSACQVAPLPGLPPAGPPLPARDFTLVLPVYNPAMLLHATTTLKPFIRANDRFMIVSGNRSGPIDTAWVNEAALELRSLYPNAQLYAATSGLENVAAAAQNLSELLDAVVYIYEPNFPNQPEFSWDFGTTLAHFKAARGEAQGGGFRSVGKPTGRPLLQPSLQNYAWNYRDLAETADELLIQTQTYCSDSADAFGLALDEILDQYGAAAQGQPWFPQITVDPTAPNGTSVSRAEACLNRARDRGIGGAVLWWSPKFPERATRFIATLNRAD